MNCEKPGDHMQNHRDAVIQFVKNEYTKTGKTPSIRRIREGLMMCNKTLYAVFQGRKREICAAAGVPYDRESSAAVEKASQALEEKRVKEKTADAELNILRSEEETNAAELRQVKAIDDAKRRRTEHEYQLASSPEGRRRIFSDPQRMLQFAARTIDYESYARSNPNVWDCFVDFCNAHRLDLAGKLFEVAGHFEEYEEHVDEEELHSYLGFKLDVFLIDRETEQRQKAMQERFDEVLRNFRCDCGRRITATFLDKNQLSCPCGTVWELKCVNCKHILQFDTSRNVFYCRHCEMSFKVEVRE
jgi:hypothetical protein